MNTLFNQDVSTKYLNVIYNDEEYLGDIHELFNSNIYDSIEICTFVSSPKYFFKQTKGYEKIELLLGIEDDTNAQKFLLDPNYTSDFFRSLDKKILNKISKDEIKILFTNLGVTIHSKIYIQRNSNTGESRVMIGSANYSNKAFGNTKQYEELIVYDSKYNKKFTSIFEQRYKNIKQSTLDFVPKHIKTKLKNEELKILTLSEEESVDILKSRIKDIQAAVLIPDELDDNIKSTKKLLAQQEETLKQEIKSIIKTKTIFEITTKVAKGKIDFITPIQFAKQKEQIITKVIQEVKVIKEFKDSRIELLYSEANSHIFLKKDKSDSFIQYAKRAENSILSDKLQLLNQFISAYTTYTMNNEEDTQKRIFEAILYSFSSTYIWRLREEAIWQQGRDEIKSSIPIFMLIAGMAQSGKTHLIKFISQIMGNHGSYYHYVKQAKLSSTTQINPQIIHQFLNEENVTPIFIDEINKEYYSSTSSATSSYMGEGFIKNMINAKEGRHPCMIATSNTDFSANAQVMRRMYYIQLNNPFDTYKKEETAEYFTHILNEFGTQLYQDFLYRLEKKFNQGIKVNINDILSPAREVFLDYFQELNIEIPSYFSQTRIDDYYIRGKTMWQDLYNMKYLGFQEEKKNNTILLDDEIIFGIKMSSTREKRELLQYLPIGVLIEEKGIVKLNYNGFFKFIDITSKNNGFLSNLFKG